MSFAREWPKLGPAWMQRERGRLFWGAVGQVLDELNAKIKQATLARFPDHTPEDGLEHIGDDRQLDQGPTESDGDYRARLKHAFDLWEMGGTHQGLLIELKAQGFPMGENGAHIVQHNGRYSYLDNGDELVLGDLMVCVNRRNLEGTIPGDLKGWTFEGHNGRDQFYSQFGIVFSEDVPALRPGTIAAARLNNAVAKWKPAKANFRGTWIIETGGCLGWPVDQEELEDETDEELSGDVVHFILPT